MSESDDLERLRAKRREELLQGEGGAGGAGDVATDAASDAAPGDAPAPDEPVHVDSAAELEALAATHRVVLADFYADWCGPCQLLDPTVRELAATTDAAVAKVDVDALPGLARELRVQGVPSLFLYVDGEPVERLVGVQDYGTLAGLVEQHA